MRLKSLRRMRGWIVFVLASALAACTGDDCTLEIAYDVSPQPADVRIGESVTPQIRMTTCQGKNQVTISDWRWESQNPSIAVVDSVSGIITGVAIGQRTVTATSRSQGFTTGLVVIVR